MRDLSSYRVWILRWAFADTIKKSRTAREGECMLNDSDRKPPNPVVLAPPLRGQAGYAVVSAVLSAALGTVVLYMRSV